MKENLRESAAIARRTNRRALETAAMVSVLPASAQQVALVNHRGPVILHTRAIGEGGMELVGQWFFPKNCLLEIAFPEIDALDPESSGDSQCLRVVGTVRKVQTIGPEPTYVLWVHLVEMDQATMGAWQMAVEFGLDAENGEA